MNTHTVTTWSGVKRWLTGKDAGELEAVRKLRFLAHVRGVTEFELLRMAYREMCHSEIHPVHIDGVFKEYLMSGKMPAWARMYVRNESNELNEEDSSFLKEYLKKAKH